VGEPEQIERSGLRCRDETVSARALDRSNSTAMSSAYVTTPARSRGSAAAPPRWALLHTSIGNPPSRSVARSSLLAIAAAHDSVESPTRADRS
jgi:hypothetical protein